MYEEHNSTHSNNVSFHKNARASLHVYTLWDAGYFIRYTEPRDIEAP
jgi:hypothetical protein